MSRFIGILGLIFLIGIAYLLSNNKKAINWKLVGIGISLQVTFTLLILKVPTGRKIFESVGGLVTKLLDFTTEGAAFLFDDLVATNKFGSIFAFQVLPTIIFFSAFMSILYYLGVLQVIISALAKGIAKLFGTSGAETLSAVGKHIPWSDRSTFTN